MVLGGLGLGFRLGFRDENGVSRVCFEVNICCLSFRWGLVRALGN